MGGVPWLGHGAVSANALDDVPVTAGRALLFLFGFRNAFSECCNLPRLLWVGSGGPSWCKSALFWPRHKPPQPPPAQGATQCPRTVTSYRPGSLTLHLNILSLVPVPFHPFLLPQLAFSPAHRHPLCPTNTLFLPQVPLKCPPCSSPAMVPMRSESVLLTISFPSVKPARCTSVCGWAPVKRLKRYSSSAPGVGSVPT